MENFTYHSLFDTKGIEYLIIIAFFLILIPFWLYLSRRQKLPLTEQVISLSTRVMRTPLGVFFNPNHTWTFLEQNGQARIGLDEIIAGMAGDFELEILTKPGDRIHRFDPVATIKQGKKTLQVRSPISGTVQNTNEDLESDPSALAADPFDSGWILAIQPADWKGETQKCLIGEQARKWLRTELSNIRDFILNQSAENQSPDFRIAMQDGGEPGPDALSWLPEEGWKRFQERFM